MFPQPSTRAANSAVGMLIMHSLLALTGLNVWFRLLITHPTSGGSNSSIMCHDMAMTPAFPFPALATNTTGTGSLIRNECAAGGRPPA